MRHRLFVALGIAGLAVTGACDERIDPIMGTVGDPIGGTASFNVTPATATLVPGRSVQLTVNSSRTLGPYNWSSNQEGVATVTEGGLVNAIGVGTATITVTSSVDRTVSASASITVRPDTTIGG